MTPPETPAGSIKQDRNFGLDLFRAVAIILVVMEHGIFLFKGTLLSNFPFFKMTDGVEMFFVLSGFLIGGILLREINANGRFGFSQLSNFWKRRWMRTLPNYYLILLVNYIFVHQQVIHEDIKQFDWKFLFFLQNFSKPFYDFFWESWSLSVEEWFYLLCPALLIIFLNFFNAKKSFLLVTMLMIIFSTGYRILSYDPNIDRFWYGETFRKLVVMRLDSIAYGLLAAWIFYYFPNFWKKYKMVTLVIGICLIVFILHYTAPHTTLYKQIIFSTICPVSAMFLLPFAESIKKAHGLIAKPITHISKISYSMYLINLAIVAEVIRDNFPPTDFNDRVMKYVLYWIVVLVVSTLLYKFYEKPIMDLRDKKVSG